MGIHGGCHGRCGSVVIHGPVGLKGGVESLLEMRVQSTEYRPLHRMDCEFARDAARGLVGAFCVVVECANHWGVRESCKKFGF